MDQRIAVMRDIERGIQSIYPDSWLTAMHASIIMVMPLDTLQASSPANTMSPLGYLPRELQDIQYLVAHCNTICIGNHIKVANWCLVFQALPEVTKRSFASDRSDTRPSSTSKVEEDTENVSIPGAPGKNKRQKPGPKKGKKRMHDETYSPNVNCDGCAIRDMDERDKACTWLKWLFWRYYGWHLTMSSKSALGLPFCFTFPISMKSFQLRVQQIQRQLRQEGW